ncbi:phosphate acetyltransferase [Gemmobacter denitrificans]|uniref:Phosphate acetyltransferase n=1 Tax=Gemmobacter denitrificans TaxID=3123040 RepID=A0ABU8BZ95_9RHOB
MKPLDRIFEACRAAPRHILLPEGEDPRVQDAAARAVGDGLARITLLADPDRVSRDIAGVTVIDPANAPDLDMLAAECLRLRGAKGVTADQAQALVRTPLVQAALRVRLGQVDGTVGGAVATTAETVRAALQFIGRAPGINTVSSFFLMLSCAKDAPIKGGMVFADCGLVIAPTAQELADIAIASAASAQALLGEQPRVALLSFSTAGSAEHASLTRIREALALVRRSAPQLEIEGEIQFDAAIDDAIRFRKAPGSTLSARPNVFVFPDLASGNIGYKIAQRLGGLTAIGPVLQGLNRPANDLSRGCSAEDILAMIAVTSVQGLSRA